MNPRFLPILALFLPTLAVAAPWEPLEEIASREPPTRMDYTSHPDVVQATQNGIPDDLSPWLTPEGEDETRGFGYEVRDVGDVSFVAGPWTYNTLSMDFVQGSLFNFLGRHYDEYDFVTIFVTQHLDFGAFYSPVQNDIEGIGQDLFDASGQYEDLEGWLFMNSIYDYNGSVRDSLFFGQEVGHRWGAMSRYDNSGDRDMLGRDQSHWSFFMHSENSTMEGNHWIETEDGVFETDHNASIGYNGLDLYNMGFIPGEEVADWFIIESPRVDRNPYNWGQNGIQRSTAPYYSIRSYVDEDEWDDIQPIRVSGERKDIRLSDVQQWEGQRDPHFDDAQKDFRMAWVIMHPSNETIDFDDYLVVEDIREDLVDLWEDMVGHRARLNTELGTTERYTLRPALTPQEVVYEPEVTDGPDIVGVGCRSSVSGATGSLWALLLLPLGLRRRRD